MNIRLFHPDDTDAVIDLWRRCELIRPWNNAELDIQRKCAVEDELFLVAVNDDDTLSGSVMAGYEGHRGSINYLAVDPAHRRHGLGRLLMQEAESRLLQRGCPKINLLVRTSNTEVIDFYTSLGFSEDACISLGKRLIPDN